MTFAEFFSLFGLSVAASLIAAPVLALCGSLLHLRREAFLGVAVPQFAAAGVALGLWLMPSLPSVQQSFLEHGHPPMLYLLPFAAGAAIAALAGYGMRAARSGAGGQALAGGFALASALTLALLADAPSGANFAATMMRGEVLQLDIHDFEALAGVALLAVLFFHRYRHALLVDAVDPEQAFALGLPTGRARRLLPPVLGAVIGCGVMTLGPILVFALLFLPPLAAAAWARGLRSYLTASVVCALLATTAAWPLAIEADLPYGPAAGLTAGACWLLARIVRRRRDRR